MMELPERIQNKLVNIALAVAKWRDLPAYQIHAIEKQAREVAREIEPELKERGEK